ncbi:hypothetical protein SAMN05444266_103522 [Chitinophaga jiangningensis]|uniref:DUF6630 domain-containing protein n=1 Tax=Chitinophaga jiangningensis TaxID=1419482 RepID=A0A1M7B4B5_9BACT|nr:hypothetical protein [Chitinophaga jiangningensis]SHL49801.1 hypothetical protein SAMN05444266_103522 [Chitinophaga jiangningensis]
MTLNISAADFAHITSTYGKINGSSILDARENVTHEIFPDKVVIGTNFTNFATYQLYFTDDTLHVHKYALEDVNADNAKMVPDEMSEEDQEELQSRWDTLVQDIKATEKLQQSGNARQTLAQLYLDIFDEDTAAALTDELPAFVKPTPHAVWEELAVSLQNSGNLAEFEWSDLTDTGIYALNELEPLQLEGIILEVPTEEEYDDIVSADDFAQASIDFVNKQLEETELRIVALGPVLDEYQAFTCISTADDRLARAAKKLRALCLVYLY